MRFRLNRPQLPSLSGEDLATGTNWTVTFADTVQTPSQALSAIRNIADPALANVTVPMPGAGMLHRFIDPDAGDTLFVVTARAPARGFIKRQDFVELSLLESIHGIAIRPNSDEVTADVGPDKVVLGKPGGLTLSPVDSGAERAPTAVRPIFDLGEWRKNQEGNFNERADALIEAAGAAASAGPEQRIAAQVDLARFYMARAMFPEAVGVLNLALSDSKPGAEDPSVLIVHALANILMGRPERGLKDLASPAIGANYNSQLWKAIASARQGKWADAREKFKSAEFAITSLPIDLQRIVIADAMHASIEVKDYPGAAKRASELDVIGIAPEQAAAVGVLRGRLAEGLGHDKDAMDEYKRAAASTDRQAATEARLLLVALKQRRDEISQEDALKELETLAITWRGDTLEVQALEMLARIYADTGRFANSFGAVRTANLLAPNLEISRQGQDAASALFAQLFLGPKGDDLPPIDALGMFYEFRELTPIGRRGDEMIRRLADRLVAVDLLDQAAELLQYQVDKRLEGAARAQVAARLAMVYLTNRKPERAIAALRSTRIADLSGELRQQRLLLEARAQSDVGRHDLALDIISNVNGREAIRLRSDIYWAARKWREVGRTDRTLLRRPLARLQTARRRREERHHPRGGWLCAGRGHYRADALSRKIPAADECGCGPGRLRDREQAGRLQQRRLRRDREDGRERRYAGRIPARDEDAVSRRDRARDHAAGHDESRSDVDRIAAGDHRNQAGESGEVGLFRSTDVRRGVNLAPSKALSSEKVSHEQARQNGRRTDRDGARRAESSCRLSRWNRNLGDFQRRQLGVPRQRGRGDIGQTGLSRMCRFAGAGRRSPRQAIRPEGLNGRRRGLSAIFGMPANAKASLEN